MMTLTTEVVEINSTYIYMVEIKGVIALQLM